MQYYIHKNIYIERERGGGFNGKGYQFGGDKGGKKGFGKDGGKKGAYQDRSKGGGKQGVKGDECKLCGKRGHWAKHCWMKGQIQSVNEPSQNSTAPPTSTTPSQLSQQPPRPPNASVKRVFNLAAGDAHCDPPFVQYALDADEHEYHDACETWWVQAVSAEFYELGSMSDDDLETPEILEYIDMSQTDAIPGDEYWIERYRIFGVTGGCPDADYAGEVGTNLSGGYFEVTLDSGADVSVMPQSWLEQGVGEPLSQPGHVVMTDAQGNRMQNFGSRFLTLDFGPAVVQDEFFASAVHAPLVSLGKMIRQGWTLEHRSDNLCLVNEDAEIPVSFRRNSLVVRAQVFAVNDFSMQAGIEHDGQGCISGSYQVQPVMKGRTTVLFNFDPEHYQSEMPSKRDARGRVWYFSPSGDPYCVSTGREFVDPTTVMSASVWKFRTTIVKVAEQWELIDFQQPLDPTDDLTEPLPGIIRETTVITMMHRTQCLPEVIGLAPPPLLQEDPPPRDGDSEELPEVVEPSQGGDDKDADMKAGDVVDEPSPPAAPGIQLERRDPETLDVGGRVLNAESSAADLKSACRTLGIGATGSKSGLFKRLVKHMQRKEAEESLSLQDAAKLASRQPVAERVPKPPGLISLLRNGAPSACPLALGEIVMSRGARLIVAKVAFHRSRWISSMWTWMALS